MKKWILLITECLKLLAVTAQIPSGLVINEILFNPATDGYDYVELYNRSQDTIDLRNMLIGNRNNTNDISSLRPVSTSSVAVVPGAYIVITPNEKWLRQHYSVSPSAIICTIKQMPSFPDDEGTVIVMSKTDSIILDEVHYSEKWHYALLNSASGVSLERINYNAASNDQSNWTSASGPSGSGTPGYQNSQFRADLQAKGDIALTPAVFSPDNDGIDDFASFVLNMHEPGYTANTIIYDSNGRRVRYFLKNALLGIQNRFRWDGLDDQQRMLPRGVYIFFTQIFNLSGQTKKFRNVIVLGNKL